MTQTWNPDVYLRYQGYRARPALDLIAQIELATDGPIVDLGCGPGNVTQVLRETWPNRPVTGVDLSKDMLAKAQSAYADGSVDWQQGDIATWRAATPPALLFSNAALHWVQNLERVIPRLAEHVQSQGCFAYQIPVTYDSAYQHCIRATVQSDRWKAKLGNVWMYKDPPGPAAMYDLLSPMCTSVDIWETDYHHVLEGENPVLEWIKGTGLTPYLTVLNEVEQAEFIADYGAQVLQAYPKQGDGSTLFLMSRIFVVARKS